jgi:A/G-specific adenine glycosylase
MRLLTNKRRLRRLEIALADPWPLGTFKSSLRRRLVNWFHRHARDLPWRKTRDPYAIWVSEIMLQQTQVATVLPYYERFLARFPSVCVLAAADEHDLLRLWEGLGYYRRARQMHAAARKIVADHGGIFPRDLHSIRALPGIGRYTAGAIASFAFDSREPILEANTIRLFSRLLAYRGDTASAAGQKLLWRAAETILPRRGSGAINQALMELGSQVCTTRRPACDLCPLAYVCQTRRDGLQGSIPSPRAKPRIEQVREAAVVVRRGGKLLLLRRGETKRWAGLWDFPRFEIQSNNNSQLARELTANVRRLTAIAVSAPRLVTVIHHGVTRFRIRLDCFEAHAASSNDKGHTVLLDSSMADHRWIEPAELSQFALSTPARRLATHLVNATNMSRPQWAEAR